MDDPPTYRLGPLTRAAACAAIHTLIDPNGARLQELPARKRPAIAGHLLRDGRVVLVVTDRHVSAVVLSRLIGLGATPCAPVAGPLAGAVAVLEGEALTDWCCQVVTETATARAVGEEHRNGLRRSAG